MSLPALSDSRSITLVHPKDRISDEEKPEMVYKILCKNVNMSTLEKQEGHWEQE